MKKDILADVNKTKNILFEAKDPDEAVDDYLLNKRVKLDGENMALYQKIKNWAYGIEEGGDFIAQLNHDENNNDIIATLQEKRGPKYLILRYHFPTKVLELEYYWYDDGADKMELKETEKTNSPSNTDYLLKKYKSFLMEKQALTEAKEKTYTEAQIDQLIRNATSSIHKLKEAVKGHLEGGKFVKQLDTIYKVLQDTPSLSTLKSQMEKEKQAAAAAKADKLRASVQEDINVEINPKSDPNTVRKAEELAKRNNGDIKLTTESVTVGELKRRLQESAKPKKVYNSTLLIEAMLKEDQGEKKITTHG